MPRKGYYVAGRASVLERAEMWRALRELVQRELRTSNGALVDTFPAGSSPEGMAFDGANIWVANYLGSSVSKM